MTRPLDVWFDQLHHDRAKKELSIDVSHLRRGGGEISCIVVHNCAVSPPRRYVFERIPFHHRALANNQWLFALNRAGVEKTPALADYVLVVQL